MADASLLDGSSSHGDDRQLGRSRSTAAFLRKYLLAGQKTSEDLEAYDGPPSAFDEFCTKNRKWIALLFPFLIVQIVYWLLAYKHELYTLFPEYWEIGAMMAFGAFVGGATAEGGGAIAFPVLTLAFHVRPAVARDFSAMIQTVGLNSAAASIRIMDVLIESHTLFFCTLGGTIGTITCLELISAHLSPTVKKIAFVSVFFSFAIALFILNREKKRLTYDKIPHFGAKDALILFVTGLVGGVFSGIAGTGLEVFAFSVITLLYRINEKVATPTTVSMAGLNSVIVFFWRHFMQQGIEPVAWHYFAVCVPIVVVFAPLGSLISSFLHRQMLASFIYVLETIALVSAFIVIRPGLDMYLLSLFIVLLALGFFMTLSYFGKARMRRQESTKNSNVKRPRANSIGDSSTELHAVNLNGGGAPRFSLA
ncbi:hypothetical protein PFISCL1PPCAC_13544 [Pristionchus fissidentatus]|uniref:Membrane transporter protein n=1 Tax=Pristionchus fissidentatus TaxID=1538716 RepID=A0AAV5VU76_9BILA|nr:hypothetical protein PFISCL1PPCAC_13544 [Pristionchus fissidentatus]